MMSLVESLESQIRQLDAPEFRQWLLDHFNPELSAECAQQLNLYHDAWPIIRALEEQGTSHLIDLMNAADPVALKAMAQLTKGTEWETFVELFLINNRMDLESVNRKRLINFLRNPDLDKTTKSLTLSLRQQASNFITLRFLLCAFSSPIPEEVSFSALLALLKKYQFPVSLHSLVFVLQYYQSQLQHKEDSSLYREFIGLVHELLISMPPKARSALISGFTTANLLILINGCINAYAKEDRPNSLIYRDVLLFLCNANLVLDKQRLTLIQEALNQFGVEQDLAESNISDGGAPKSQGGPHHQITMENPLIRPGGPSRASGLLPMSREKGKMKGSYLEAPSPHVWGEGNKEGGYLESEAPVNSLARRLYSPRIMVNASEAVINQLILCYECFLLTLNEEQLLTSLASLKRIDVDEWALTRFSSINQQLTDNPGDERLIAKKRALVTWCIECCVNAVLIDLALHSAQYRMPYNSEQSFPTFRMDVLVALIDNAYRKPAWLKPHSPEYENDTPLLHHELRLYDADGHTIAWVDEANRVWDALSEEPALLVARGRAVIGMILYNQEKQVIGRLTSSGQLLEEQALRKNFSADLLSGVPEVELERTLIGLDLLITNLLFANSIDALYKNVHALPDNSVSKHLWLMQQISRVVATSDYDISAETMNALVSHFDADALFALLLIKHSGNAFALFRSMINKAEYRDLLLLSDFESEFTLFLQQQGVVPCFAEYLKTCYNEPWFVDGLRFFAVYGKKQNKPGLLGEALALLPDQVLPLVMAKLIESERELSVLLNEFLGMEHSGAKSEVGTSDIYKILAHFNKQHLLFLIQQLNQTKVWQESPVYRFILLILYWQHDQLFPKDSATEFWMPNELKELAAFICRLLRHKTPTDNESFVGSRVLGELVFRCAKAGDTSLFYSGKALNPLTVSSSFKRVFLAMLVDKFWLPREVQDNLLSEREETKPWIEYREWLAKQLKEHKVFQEWHSLLKKTWSGSENRMPIMSVYLLNYLGPGKVILSVLNDYFNGLYKYKQLIHPVSQLLVDAPDRDISALIFNSLQTVLIKRPELLDSVILSHMASYYAKKSKSPSDGQFDAEIALLTHWGQAKQYPLVHHGCTQLLPLCEDRALKRRLVQGNHEAQVESRLQVRLNEDRFYAQFFKWLNRLWHYGFNQENKSSKIVAPCDTDSIPLCNFAVKEVQINVDAQAESGSPDEFAEKRKQFLLLLATIVRSVRTVPSGARHAPVISQSIFNTHARLASPLLEEEVAGQEAQATV